MCLLLSHDGESSKTAGKKFAHHREHGAHTEKQKRFSMVFVCSVMKELRILAKIDTPYKDMNAHRQTMLYNKL
jgi:hypothetical protein